MDIKEFKKRYDKDAFQTPSEQFGQDVKDITNDKTLFGEMASRAIGGLAEGAAKVAGQLKEMGSNKIDSWAGNKDVQQVRSSTVERPNFANKGLDHYKKEPPEPKSPANDNNAPKPSKPFSEQDNKELLDKLMKHGNKSEPQKPDQDKPAAPSKANFNKETFNDYSKMSPTKPANQSDNFHQPKMKQAPAQKNMDMASSSSLSSPSQSLRDKVQSWKDKAAQPQPSKSMDKTMDKGKDMGK